MRDGSTNGEPGASTEPVGGTPTGCGRDDRAPKPKCIVPAKAICPRANNSTSHRHLSGGASSTGCGASLVCSDSYEARYSGSRRVRTNRRCTVRTDKRGTTRGAARGAAPPSRTKYCLMSVYSCAGIRQREACRFRRALRRRFCVNTGFRRKTPCSVDGVSVGGAA
jgi:hypothetical protein